MYPTLREALFTLLMLGALVLALSSVHGCASMKQSEFWQHPTVYAGWEHQKFSTWGYRNPDMYDHFNSQYGEWWGYEVEIKEAR